MSKGKKHGKKNHSRKKAHISSRPSLFTVDQDLKRNETRNDCGISVFQRYQNNEEYKKWLVNIYDKYYQIPPLREAIDKLHRDLEKYAGEFIPDYMGYQNHLYDTYYSKMVDSYKSRPEYMIADPDQELSEDNSFVQKVLQDEIMLLPLIYAKKEEEVANHIENEEQTDRATSDYRIWKLLTLIFSGDYSFMLDVIMACLDSKKNEYLDDDLTQINNRALVQRFFESVRKREKTVCYKVLGRALDRLDPGETDYLEAIAHYYDQEYDAAIRYASKVKEDNADYGAAVALLLECYSAKGDIHKLAECLEANRKVKYSKYQLRYLLQNTAMNYLGEPDHEWVEKMRHILMIKTVDKKDKEYYDRIVKNAAERILDIYNIYYNQSYYPNEFDGDEIDDNDGYKIINSYAVISVTDDFYDLKKVELMLSKINEGIDLKRVDAAWLDDFRFLASDMVFNMAINRNPSKSIEMDVYCFDYLYRLGMVDSFEQNVVENIKALTLWYKKTRDEKIANVLLSAYAEGSIKGKMDPTLKSFVESEFNSSIDEDSINQNKVKRNLSKNASIALESAEALFALSKTVDWGWKDAGMLSLSYFRIVEVEINQRLLLPLFGNLGAERIRSDFESVRDSLSGKDKESYTNRWTSIVSTLEKIINKTADVDGLMLGGMEFLFRNIGSKFSEYDILAKNIRGAMSEMLDDETDIDDFIRFMEHRVVNKNTRDKYRNPPAHSKYLPYATACECREYFYKIMLKFHSNLRFDI